MDDQFLIHAGLRLNRIDVINGAIIGHSNGAAVTPQSVALPGRCGATFSQTLSAMTKRSVFMLNSLQKEA